MDVAAKISDLLESRNAQEVEKGLRLAEGSNSPKVLAPLFRMAVRQSAPLAGAAGKLVLKKSLAYLRITSTPLDSAVAGLAKKVVETIDPSFVLHLNYKVESGTPEEMVDALILLKHFVSKSRAQEILKLCIRNPEKKVRATAVKHIGEFASKVNAEVLSKYLEDSDNRVKANAIEVFETLNNKYFTRILNRFRKDSNNRVRANALKALFLLGERDIEKDIEMMLISHHELMVASAIWLVGELGSEEPKLLELLTLVSLEGLEEEGSMIQNNMLMVLKKVGNIPKADFIRESLRDQLKERLKQEGGNKKELVLEASQSPEYFLFKLNGILTAGTLLNVKSIVEEALSREKIFVVDFTDLEYIDSSGVGFLINFQKKLKGVDGALFIFGCNFKILELMQISKIDTVIDVFNTRDEIHKFLGIPS